MYLLFPYLSSLDSDEEKEEKPVKGKETSWTDQVRMIHLRRYIDDKAQDVEEKDYTVQKIRSECRCGGGLWGGGGSYQNY